MNAFKSVLFDDSGLESRLTPYIPPEEAVLQSESPSLETCTSCLIHPASNPSRVLPLTLAPLESLREGQAWKLWKHSSENPATVQEVLVISTRQTPDTVAHTIQNKIHIHFASTESDAYGVKLELLYKFGYDSRRKQLVTFEN